MDDENSRMHHHLDGKKPLKKARYIWEVKGKHHLKTAIDEQCEASTSTSSKMNKSNTKGDCYINGFRNKTDEILDKKNLNSSESDSDENYLKNVANNDPVTLVETDQDYHLKRWQARQIARGFVDNTINHMLENMTDRSFDADTFVDDCENDGQIEDDAILMAIQSHGLQPSGWRMTEDCLGPHYNSTSINNKTETSISEIENLQYNQQEINQINTVASTSNYISMFHCDQSKDDLNDSVNNFIINAAVTAAIQKKGLTYG